ncbi:MAG TPA: MFS transporter [Chloroflexota bacterium]|jgi:MFS family permease
MADIRSLGFALAGTFALRCASYGAGIIIPVFLGLKSRHDDAVTVGIASLIAISFYAAELIGAPVFGALSDRYGRKPFMILGPVFGGVAIQLLGFTSVVPVLIVVRLLEGLSTASSAPSTLGFLSARTGHSERLRSRVMGFYQAATVVGLASGAALGGQIYQYFKDWRAFTAVALIYVVALLLFLPVRDTGAPAGAADGHALGARSHSPRAILTRMLNPQIMRFAPAWLAANAVIGAWFSVGPFLAAGRPNPSQFFMGGYESNQIGIAFMVFGIVFTLGAITWGFVMPRIGRQATLLVGVVGLAAATVMFWVINQVPRQEHSFATLVVLMGLLVVAVFVQSGFTPAALAYLAEIAEDHPEDRGAVMGLYSVLLSIGQLLGGAIAGPFANRGGVNGLIVLTALLTGVAAATVLQLGAAERRARSARRVSQPAESGPGA